MIAKEGPQIHSCNTVVTLPEENRRPEDSRQGRKRFGLRGQLSSSHPHVGLRLLHLLYTSCCVGCVCYKNADITVNLKRKSRSGIARHLRAKGESKTPDRRESWGADRRGKRARVGASRKCGGRGGHYESTGDGHMYAFRREHICTVKDPIIFGIRGLCEQTNTICLSGYHCM